MRHVGGGPGHSIYGMLLRQSAEKATERELMEDFGVLEENERLAHETGEDALNDEAVDESEDEDEDWEDIDGGVEVQEDDDEFEGNAEGVYGQEGFAPL